MMELYYSRPHVTSGNARSGMFRKTSGALNRPKIPVLKRQARLKVVEVNVAQLDDKVDGGR